nr:restriction endonuclease subunit S [Rickettsia endosymbiont of Ceutorhynchus assimilis]
MQEKLKDTKMQESPSLFVKLGDVVEIPLKMPKISPDTEVSFLGMADISKEGTIINNHRCTYSNLSKGYSKFLEGDVLVAKIGCCFENGKGALATGLINSIGFGSTEFHVLRATKKINPYILFNITLSKSFRVKGKLEETGSTHKRVPLSFIENYQIFLPPLPEQQKIASILRTWDKAIWELGKLYTAKEKKYKAITQNIFKNQAINEKWLPASLSSISNIRKGKQLNRLDMKGGIYPVWNGGITPSGFTNEWNAEADTITISEGGNSCGFVNLCKEKFWLGGHCYAVTGLAANINKYFLYFQLKINEPKLMKLTIGSGLPNIQKEAVHTYIVHIPPIDKQNKIANLLGSLYSELEIYKKQISIIKSQKQGLMQKLLTGQWRVKVDEERM